MSQERLDCVPQCVRKYWRWTDVVGVFLTVSSVQGLCVRKASTPALVNDLSSQLQCVCLPYPGSYCLECDQGQSVESFNLTLPESDICGVRLKCSGAHRLNVSISLQTNFSDLWLDISQCGYKYVFLDIRDDFSSDSFSNHSLLINASYNSFRSIADLMISSVPKEVNILMDMSWNHLFNIIDEDFSDDFAKQISWLVLEGNVITHVVENAFQKLTSLQYLDMSHNALEEIPEVKFHYNLSFVLILSDNKIVGATGSPFAGANLQLLNISYNGLTEVTMDLFARCRQLAILDFSTNQIVSIENGVFGSLASLTELDLSNNFLAEISVGMFTNATDLKIINLSNNSIDVIPNGAFKDARLTHLDLSWNEVDYVTRYLFEGLDDLLTLDLSHNIITYLGSETFKKMTLQSLDLSHNPLQEFLDDVFKSASVTHLKMADCLLTEFPHASISGPKMASSLTDLDLSGNAITRFPSVLPGEEYIIEVLDLSSNQIQTVDCQYISKSITHLYLHNNSITTIDNCLAIQSTFANAKITLGHNPLNCCHLQWLHILINRTNCLLDHEDTWCDKPGVTLLMNEFDTNGCGNEEEDEQSAKCYSKQDLVGVFIGTVFGILLIELALVIVFLVCKNKNKRDQITEVSKECQNDSSSSDPDAKVAGPGVYIEPIGSTTDTGEYEPGCHDPNCTHIHTEASELPYIELKTLSRFPAQINGERTAEPREDSTDRLQDGRIPQFCTITAIKVVHNRTPLGNRGSLQGEDRETSPGRQVYTAEASHRAKKDGPNQHDIVYIETVNYAAEADSISNGDKSMESDIDMLDNFDPSIFLDEDEERDHSPEGSYTNPLEV